MAWTFLALGGNLGDVEDHFKQAIAHLHQLPNSQVKSVSSIFVSEPVGSSAGAPFHNAVLELETGLDPQELLKSIQAIENRFGRDRSVRWGPRPLDIDIILYEDQILSLPELIIPHPACWYRRFVFEPMAEIASDVIHPVLQKTFGELKTHFERTPLSVFLAGGDSKERINLIDSLKKEFPGMIFRDWNEGRNQSEGKPGLILWLGEDPQDSIAADDLPLFPCLDLSDSGEELEARIQEVVQSTLPVQK